MIGGSQLQKRAKERGINREIKGRAGPFCLQCSCYEAAYSCNKVGKTIYNYIEFASCYCKVVYRYTEIVHS
jgi:hypothetical protein